MGQRKRHNSGWGLERASISVSIGVEGNSMSFIAKFRCEGCGKLKTYVPTNLSEKRLLCGGCRKRKPALTAMVIERLRGIVAKDEISIENGATPQRDDNDRVIRNLATCGNCGMYWNDALITSRTPAPSARCP